MHTISCIRREINRAPVDHIFTTRDFLAFGLRAAVDQALSRLVKREILVRVARGVFIKDGTKVPAAEQVAKRKAQAFGREVIKHCADIAHEFKLLLEGNAEPTFATSGRTSSFRFGNTRIHFKAVTPRKIKLGESTTGKGLRALWHIGKALVTADAIMQVARSFNRLDMEAIKPATQFMPAWLTNVYAWRWHFYPKKKIYCAGG